MPERNTNQPARGSAHGRRTDGPGERRGLLRSAPGQNSSTASRHRFSKRNFVVGLGLLTALCASTVALERQVIPTLQSHLPWSEVPPRGAGAAPEPLGLPPNVQESTAYRLHPSPRKGQAFVAYDPCRPIHYVIRPDGAPAGAGQLIHEAAAAVSAASGLELIYDGSSTEAPSEQRTTYQPERYGKRWVPVLVTWSSPAEVPALAGDTAGLGGSSYASAAGTELVYVAGQINLDGPDLAAMMRHPDGPEHVRAVITHEFGHVLGLGHVDDPTQLMYEGPSYRTNLGAGDLAGLAVLGAGPCVPEL